MIRYNVAVTLLGLIFSCHSTIVSAQGMGGYGGFGSSTDSNKSFDDSASWTASTTGIYGSGLENTVMDYISVNGTAEVRLTPTEIRVVMAVLSEGKSADATHNACAEKVRKVCEAWEQLGVPREKIAEDFINVLPWYEWIVEESKEHWPRVARQEQAGYRMQTNLHVVVPTESKAMEAINAAFQHGVNDIVTFDYWNPEIEEHKKSVRVNALNAAKEKAELFLAAFDEPPKLINVNEQAAVVYPNSLYKTFENVLEEEFISPSETRRVKAYRPKMTFYRGLQSNPDVGSKEMVMRPEITVISTVTLYYQSPAEKHEKKKRKSAEPVEAI